MTMLFETTALEIIRRISVCPECGDEGRHWISGIFGGAGFWTCAKFYGADGRRKPEHIDPAAGGGIGAFLKAMHEFGMMPPNVK